MTVNPYEAPQSASDDRSVLCRIRLPAGIAYVIASVSFVVIYMSIWLPLTPRHLPVRIWPVIAIPFVLSIVAAGRIRRSVVAPLVCVLGISSSSLVFALFRDWYGAEFQIVVPVAIMLSIPSILITVLRRQKRVQSLVLPMSVGTNVVSVNE